MLLRLARKNTELYPADPVKREKIYNKYKVRDTLNDTTYFLWMACQKLEQFLTLCFLFGSFLSKQQFEIIEEEVEWVGLSLEEALEKQRQLEHKVTKHS